MPNPLEKSIVGRTIDAWESTDAALSLEIFLASIAGASLRARADAILVDQQFRKKRGDFVRAEVYFERYPDLADDPEVRLDLVYGELRLLDKTDTLLTGFDKRFPGLHEALQRQAEVSTWLDSDIHMVGGDFAGTGTASPIEASGFDPAPLLFSDYELHECLGSGAFGEVYRAIQKSLDKPVAIKIHKQHPGVTPDAFERFFREARITASLQHPNIAGVHGVGRCPEGGGFFLVMDLIEGHTLQEEMIDGPLPSKEAARVVADTAAALHYAHSRGIIHRDIKPSNVLRTPRGQIVVVDFGLAKAIYRDGQHLSMEGVLVGTPQFMAPEQIDSAKGAVSTQTDIYGLGALLYYLLTGQTPFGGDNILEAMSHVLHNRRVSPPSDLQREVTSDLDRICLDCLERNPLDRPASAREVELRLRECLDETPSQQISTVGVNGKYFSRQQFEFTTKRRLTAIASICLLGAAGYSFYGTSWNLPKSASSVLTNQNTDQKPENLRVDVLWQGEIFTAQGELDSKKLVSPVKQGDRLKIRVSLSESCYAYFYWVGSDGSVQWLREEGAQQEPADELVLPSQVEHVLPVQGSDGLEFCLLLLRSEPLSHPSLLTERLVPCLPLPSADLAMPLADGIPVTSESRVEQEALAKLAKPHRTVGPAEPLIGSETYTAIADWKQSWPHDLGEWHFLAIPHLNE